ncbi:hypothetical protein LSH36_108g01119 [Paralvinella palmiformis]|uniref:Fucosyltransferase n=1 Tax=Paralvinella palmiformis TaxID=53620 RepID=A0AAD9N9I5_9ANNE|nr:hypothetical protein LSH36_108g01119 [Paralvinella palmiformis]
MFKYKVSYPIIWRSLVIVSLLLIARNGWPDSSMTTTKMASSEERSSEGFPTNSSNFAEAEVDLAGVVVKEKTQDTVSSGRERFAGDVKMGSSLKINKESAKSRRTGGISVSMSKPHPLDDNGTKILSTPKSMVAPHVDPSVKTILLWTAMNTTKMWWFVDRNEFGREVFVRHKCSHTNCNLIYDRSRVHEADFLMFHDYDPPEWPKIRYTWQSYIHIIKERPGPWHRWLKYYEPRINITMNYRHDSDIPRDDYIAELSKHIDVDIFGNCGTLVCPKGVENTKACLERLQREYKFFLAFENAICKDYVTEKIYRTLHYELVPVALGMANYSRDAPPHSVIDVRDFESPKALAEYLEYLSRNEEEYYSYFAWKERYNLMSLQDFFCTLCDALNDPAIANKKAGGYFDWWFTGCDNDLVERMRIKAGW